MLNEYMELALRHATYEQIEDGSFFGEIPSFDGLWASAGSEPECRDELRSVLEGWILLHIADHDPLPQVDG